MRETWSILQGQPQGTAQDNIIQEVGKGMAAGQIDTNKVSTDVAKRDIDDNVAHTATTTAIQSGANNATSGMTSNVATQPRTRNDYTQPSATEAAAERERATSLSDVVQLMREEAAKSKAASEYDKEREQKRRKREAWVGAMADGLSSLVNLVGTTKGAPNQYDASKGMLPQMMERWDKIDKEREANKSNYINYMSKVASLQQSNADYLRKMRGEARDAQRKDDETERKQALMEAQAGRQKALEDKDNAMLAYYNAKIDELAKTGDLKVANLKADKELKEARKQQALAGANKLNNSTSGGGKRVTSSKTVKGEDGKYRYYDKEGGVHYAASTEEAKRRALEEGTWVDDYAYTNSDNYDKRGRIKGKVRQKIVKGGHSERPTKSTGVSWGK